ncbi:SGNH/GDSL hydrolase family protein [Dyadobacter sp. LHD-138]|uniref:SGNH/GDSL hydrolase family protein n=1 Tax=Dyadobacter sp. LHD-138 TaxID=3071413 RepID=UPI0027DECA5E|nr:SGNH/GDSL hydrolase family protein [Dyadobacter sp. LHD-138]MDQ6480645.1 SGNH/GDSL hydrolase family protein [Dyadobacter sp. LHD-138]
MNSFFKLAIFISFFSSANAQDPAFVKESLKPFWKGKMLHNESVMMISRQGKPAEATLLFKPRRIISIKNAGLNIEYKRGVDWDYKDGKLVLLPGSSAIFMKDTELYSDTAKRSFPKKGGGKILFAEGAFFHEKQLSVTYKHKKGIWKGPVPVFQGENLPHTYGLLKKKEAVHILLNGDSIAAGANASGRSNAAPYLPDWGILIQESLKNYYKTEIKFTNSAVGGMDSEWGKKNVEDLIVKHHPDLSIIAFGMNDGTGKVSPAKFKANISDMINGVRKDNPNAEFILVATMLPNPESFFTGTQPEFKKALEELTGPGIVLVDMTEVHRELLKRKSYQDLTGNNINHPNDFLIRWYAQEIAGVLMQTGY